MRTLIRNATVVLPGGEMARTAVLLHGSRIAAIDPPAHTHADDVIDAVKAAG